MASLEVPMTASNAILSTDSRFDFGPPDPDMMAAPKWSFAYIVEQTTVFLKMDIPLKL